MNTPNEAPLSNMPPNEAERLAIAARDALTDSMVERMTVTAANAAEVIDRLNDEETRDAVHGLIDRLTDLHKIGAMDTLFDTVALLHAARSAATDSIVERLFAFVEHMLNTVGSEEMVDLLDNVRTSLDEAAVEAEATPAKGGLFAALSLLSKPETQRSLTFLLGVGERLRKSQSGS